MLNNNRVIALIPARGGSKRLPKKNVLPLAGKPLISWTINSAIACEYVDRVIVSTDDNEIASIALECGAEIPFKRPGYLGQDSTSTIDVIQHAVDALNLTDEDIILLLQPTSPLRTELHISEALLTMQTKGAEGVISITPCTHSPLWTNTLPSNGSMKGFLSDEVSGKRSQDLPQYYRLNGAIYAFNVKSIRNKKTIDFSCDYIAYVMDENCSIDIDTKLDLNFCEIILEKSSCQF